MKKKITENDKTLPDQKIRERFVHKADSENYIDNTKDHKHPP